MQVNMKLSLSTKDSRERKDHTTLQIRAYSVCENPIFDYIHHMFIQQVHSKVEGTTYACMVVKLRRTERKVRSFSMATAQSLAAPLVESDIIFCIIWFVSSSDIRSSLLLALAYSSKNSLFSFSSSFHTAHICIHVYTQNMFIQCTYMHRHVTAIYMHVHAPSVLGFFGW